VYDKDVIEIKCPWSFQRMTVDEGIRAEAMKNTTKKGEPSVNQQFIKDESESERTEKRSVEKRKGGIITSYGRKHRVNIA